VILFEHVFKEYPNGITAVDDLSLEVVSGETIVLLGTSGCGKTTTLKMVNRLLEPTSGHILVEGKDILEQDPIPLRRRMGYAIQEIGLLPHMTISDNIAVVPKLLKWPKQRIEERVAELLEMVRLEPANFRSRYPSQLSGGQQQRVGVARALAADPPIILMDEPFGALDPITREQLQNEFMDLMAKLKKTVLFVTHDVFEAVKVGTRIALLDKGKLQQVDSPGRLVEQPANEFVETFLGSHRFQLSLTTSTIKKLPLSGSVAESVIESNMNLKTSDSFLTALDLFKKTGLNELPVVEDRTQRGYLKKRVLLDAVTRTISKPETTIYD
jgi:osmoprotectant transport system ATP-binding protein